MRCAYTQDSKRLVTSTAPLTGNKKQGPGRLEPFRLLFKRSWRQITRSRGPTLPGQPPASSQPWCLWSPFSYISFTTRLTQRLA